jgi:hypothetical protein
VKSILLAYDNTELRAQHALDRAGTLARAINAHLIVTSVAPVHISNGRSVAIYDPAGSPVHHADELREARAYLDR